MAEADLRNLDLSAGFNSVDYAQLDARFTRLDFLGGARELLRRRDGAQVREDQARAPRSELELAPDRERAAGTADQDELVHPGARQHRPRAQREHRGVRQERAERLRRPEHGGPRDPCDGREHADAGVRHAREEPQAELEHLRGEAFAALEHDAEVGAVRGGSRAQEGAHRRRD